MLSFIAAIACLATADLPVIHIDRDNVEITHSSRITIADHPIADVDNNGVIHITGDGISVDFTNAHLRGATDGTLPNRYEGISVRITGRDVTILGGAFSSYKVGILAVDADGLTIDGADVSDNFRQRLRSTRQHEAAEDWLRPHENDEQEWRKNYGAGICIENAAGITIRNVRARSVQNGIILDRVRDSKIYDNDCSFLSGWGLAMWRSGGNTISRNAFDFCVRGYSHGVYNRGQDSAGILMFEQCSKNIIAENSVTHGGDGVFAFAGREALGQVNARDDEEFYQRLGNNQNIFARNDLSYAAAHGLELTFSFFNVIAENRFTGNAICGIWGGFSQHTAILFNHFTGNGEMPYGSERGGINIEHGSGNSIYSNWFADNACGVFFWTREHTELLQTLWAKANHRGSTENYIGSNTFQRDRIAIQLRRAQRTLIFGNQMIDVGTEIDADEESSAGIGEGAPAGGMGPRLDLPGQSTPVGAREHLSGRHRIIMTEWGPYDWETPGLILHERSGERHVYRLLGVDPEAMVFIGGSDGIHIAADEVAETITIFPNDRGALIPYRLEVLVPQHPRFAEDVFVPALWAVRVFAWENDPRENIEAWRAEARANATQFIATELQLHYGHGGPSQLPNAPQHVRHADLPRDRFGTIATTRLTFPAGSWRIRTLSDDGIRVWLDDELIIDDWTVHGPTEHTYDLITDLERTIEVRIEHFAVDGYAKLTFDIERGEALNK